jgi:hypothetical protein
MSEVNCIRKSCIEDPDDLYHVESHVCFVCGAEFEPTPGMIQQICDECNWYNCPVCGGCKCSLSDSDAAWVDSIRASYCQSVNEMAGIRVKNLPDTDNPNVKLGLGIQLRFCRRWAIGQLRMDEIGEGVE